MLTNVGFSPLLASANWPIFPENGLDRSLHAPIFIGLLLVSFFAETLGWTYAGLVVPGYLAAVFVSAPVTGALVVVEAVLAYFLTALVGLWLPKTGAWSSSFGRERFFLFIVSAVLVRLAVEGNFIPWLSSRYEFAHSRELYSLGLVLVPLLANAFWNAGMLNTIPRLGFITLVTFACVKYVLLTYTNFTVSRFAIANEAVSLTFLESPHAHIILLVGALLAARNNLLYGWDYNGILVPALLAVAWYQPVKLATTLAEALVIFWIARAITSHGPLKRVLIVGSRRMVMVFLVGLAGKFLLGFGVMRWAPSVQMVDYFGFGYLLPSLLAAKMWNKQKVGIVIMPTLQVSLSGFVLGNVLGFALSVVDLHFAFGGPRKELAVNVGRPATLELMLGDSAPAPRLPAAAAAGLSPSAVTLLAAQELAKGELSKSTERLMADANLTMSRDSAAGWLTLTPSLALRGPTPARAPWLVIAVQARSSSAITAAAQRVAELLDARAVVVRSRLPEVATFDDAFVESLLPQLDIQNVLVVTEGSRSQLNVVGTVPVGFDLNGLAKALHVPLGLSFRARNADGAGQSDAPRLELMRTSAERIGAEALGTPDIQDWSGGVASVLRARSEQLTQVGSGGYRGPSIEELRVFGAVVWPALERLRSGGLPSSWERAMAARLGYHFVRLTGAPPAFMLCELPGPERRGNASFVVTPRGATAAPAIEVPAALWERGTLAAGLSLYDALDSELLILPGALPDHASTQDPDLRRPSGRRSFYHSVHERWLATSGKVIAIHGIAPEYESDEDAVLSFGREILSLHQVPGWSTPLVQALKSSGLRLGIFDGAARHVSFEGSGEPAFEYARRFGDQQMAMLWLSSRVREHWVGIQEDDLTEARLLRAQTPIQELDVAIRANEIANCLSRRDAAAAHCPKLRSGCDAEKVEAGVARYGRTQNPYELFASVPAAGGCAIEWLRDRNSGRLWIVATGAKQARLSPLQGRSPAHILEQPVATSDLKPVVSLGIATVVLAP
jgi:hypothetical protein